MDCNIISNYKSIKTQLGNGIECDEKINKLSQLVLVDYSTILSNQTGYTCKDKEICNYCNSCSTSTISCNIVEITSNGPNNLMVSYLGESNCYDIGAMNDWRVSLYLNVTFNNIGTVLTSNITSVYLDAVLTTITSQSNVVYDTLNSRYEIQFKALDNLLNNTGTMKVNYTVSDGTSTISLFQYISLDNKNLC
jgi:hypothetical protein